MDPRLEELIEEGEGAEEVEVILKLRQGDIIPPHVRIITQFGNIATCRLRRDQIRTTWEHPSTVSVKGSRYVAAEPEFVEGGEALDTGNHPSDSRRPDSMEVTGRNVVIGIVDWGLDVGHLNFRRDDDSTRLLALWDQGNTTAIEKPAPYGYGAVYSPDEINRALQSPRPYETLGYHPADSDPLGYGTHGTHVCDIAAGNGRVEGSPLGIAPEADIVFVHLAARGTGGLANLGDSVRILEALDFIARIAGNRPWVVNLSLGRCGGPHTGLTLVEQGMDALLLHAPGRAICMSTGNYFDERVHTAGQLRPGQKHTLTWWTNKADITPNELECWYSGHDVFTVEVRPPEGNVVSHVPLGGQRSIQSDGKEVGRIYHRARDPGMGDNHIDIFLYPGAPSGSWLVTLIGEDIVDGRFHCWVERDNPCPQCQSRFDPQDAVPTSTIGTICNGFRTIAVGAYNPHSPDLEVAIFSSSGPTADGRQKPDLIAPGVRILAARSSSRNQHIEAPMLTRKSGTSMASPHVTGTLACMFEAAQRPLWIHETRKLLLSTCTTVSGPPEIAVRMGNGYLDIKKAVDAARIFTNEEQNSDRKIGKDVVMNGNDEYSRGEELEDELFNENKEGEDEEYEEYVEEDDDEYGETSKERNFILISGGPGLFDDRDVEHDKSWANYVTPPLLMTDTEEKRKKFAQDDEEVWWFVYKPAYESRWDDDLKQGRKSTKEVKDKGFTSYVNLIEKRAKDRDWNLRWLNAADDLWKKLKTFSKGSISRVWYWGHARDDLWLSLGHSSASEAIAPESHEIILVSSIDGNKKLRDRFQKGNSKRIHRFVGCNTSAFAQAWSKAFKVWTEGVEEKVDFADIHKTGGEPSLVGTAKIKFFSPKGIEADPTEAWQVEFAAAEDSWTEESDDELFEAEEDNNEETEVSEICECKDDEEQDDEVFPEDMKNFGGELVALADEAIFTGNGILSGCALLRETLSKAGIAESVSPLGVGNFPSAAEIFDAFALGASPALRRHFEQFFEVAAAPGERLNSNLRSGDFLVRRAFGEGNLAHVALLVTGEALQAEELASMGMQPESRRPGLYAEVIDAGPFPHRHGDKFARRLGDENGQLSHDNLILRIRYDTQDSLRPLFPWTESGFESDEQARMAEALHTPRNLLEDQVTQRPAAESPLRSTSSASSLPFLLTGPIVRRATPEAVWFWFACSKEVKGCTPSITAYDPKGNVFTHLVDKELKEIVLLLGEFRVVRLGENIWIVLCSAVPKSGKFPTDIILGYELSISTEENGNIKTTKLADLDLNITYAPFPRPTFVIGELNRRLDHGSCRRPGAHGEDASRVFDEWMAKNVSDAFKRPASLILTGDQIYADDVAVPLFEAVRRIAFDIFGYVEKIPNPNGIGLVSVDNYSWKNKRSLPDFYPLKLNQAFKLSKVKKWIREAWSGRKQLTHRLTSPIGFTTEDGEAHLLSFPEYAAMYLAVWNPEICKSYGVDDGSDKNLKEFDSAVRAFRRIIANTATYMLCDDHEITDDWNLDQQWEDATKKNAMARRIIANGLAAYWAFQAWGNDPDMFDNNFVEVLSLYFEQLRSSRGYPRNVGSRSPYNAPAKYEELLLNTHWSFMAASNPKALCVDTRTRRETPKNKTTILSGKRVWPFMEKLLTKHGFRKGETLLLVLPTPFLPHRSMMYIQSKEYEWPDDRYEGDFEFYGNNSQQRAELVLWLQQHFGPSSLVIFSGDVHHGSVVTGRYGYGPSLDKIKAGKADWAMRIVQVTSSPIKNVKSVAYEKKRWWTLWQTDAGNAGESLIAQWETQYASTTEKTYIAMQAFTRRLGGELGRKTYVFENHFCVVDVPAHPGGWVNILFVGVKNGKLATASVSVDTDNDPSKFQVVKLMGNELPKGVLSPQYETTNDQGNSVVRVSEGNLC